MTAAMPLSEGERQRLGEAGQAWLADKLAQLRAALVVLPDKPDETPEATLRALWHLAAGRPLSMPAAQATELDALDTTQQTQLDALLARRLADEPLAYLTGRQRFMGLDLLAGPDALIPRRETELLGETASALLARLAAEAGAGATVEVLDVCTGSGNLALGLAHQVAAARVQGADLSEEAVGLARRNAEFCGLAGRVSFRSGDLLVPFDGDPVVGQVDLIVCNPPYISSAKLTTMPAEIAQHEPKLAFDGGPFGIRILQRLMREAPRYLKPGGWLAFEVGLGQAPAMAQWLQKTGAYQRIDTVADEAGQARVVVAQAV
ncbi:MAG: release factor glutamine methyltransferase [Pseudomonadota bacterium]|jgi:release factor glutamine methyltransferase